MINLTTEWDIIYETSYRTSMAVNGKAFTFNQSVVSGLESGKILVDIDSGFSLPPIPSTAVDFIYSSIPGSVFVGNVSIVAGRIQWLVPCTGVANVTMTFG